MRPVVWYLVLLGGLVLVPALALAQVGGEPRTIDFIPEVPLPNFVGGPISSTLFLQYLRAVFIYFMGVVGVLATVRIIYGGIKWVTAAGNPSRINDARETINSAIIGVLIALSSVVLLNVISPQYTEFQGLTITPVDQVLLNFERSITTSIGPFTECSANRVTGEPNQACYTPSAPICSDGLNDWVNTAAGQYAVDPFLVKSIIRHEGWHPGQQKIISRPTDVKFRSGQRQTTAYGIGQFVVATMIDLLREVNRGLPKDCPERGNIDPSTNTLIASCARWMDTHLETQVKMTALYLKKIGAQRCVKNDPRLTALGYFLGPGNAERYCTGQGITLGDTPAERQQRLAQGLQYVNEISLHYQRFCDASSSAPSGSDGGRRPPPV